MKQYRVVYILSILLILADIVFSSSDQKRLKDPLLLISQDKFPENSTSFTSESDTLSWLKAYNVAWNTPGNKAIHSMPVGGGNISLNVWATQNELLFYIGSPDSWIDGNVPGEIANVKLARVRLNITPNPFSSNFQQELDLSSNSIMVSGEANNGTKINLRIWVDVYKPVVHLEGDASGPVHVSAQLETWRGEVRFDHQSVLWSFRNEGPSRARSASITKQGIQAISSSVPDPIENLTFGGRMTGVGMIAHKQVQGKHEGHGFSGCQLRTEQAVKQLDIQLALRIEQDPTIKIWEKGVYSLEENTINQTNRDWKNTRDWWRSFWNRSYIVINPEANKEDPAWQAGRNYQLFRVMLAANSSGRFPNLFNGAAFISETNPDQRHWGQAGFTAQNQRLSYWPLLKTGDSDVLQVALDFYASRLDLERAWAKHFWNVDGAVFPECPDVFGMPVRMARKDGTSSPDVLRRHWTSGMEFALMMLECESYTNLNIKKYIPVADAAIRFFDSYYRKQNKGITGNELDEKGHLVIYPANALEAYPEAKNPSCALSGLIALSNALLSLPEEMITKDDRDYYEGFRKRLPKIPVRMISQDIKPERGYLPFYKVISPAEEWHRERWDNNMELPQLYPVFPFKLYGVGRPGLELAQNTWKYGYSDEMRQKSYFGWFQGGIFTACLGFSEEAKEYLLATLLHPKWPDPSGNEMALERSKISLWPLRWMNPEWELPRYPVFYDTQDFNQRPDLDHGSTGMIQIQQMLMQTVDDRILLFPAWPEDWDVDFKLHAPSQTVVEVSVRNGKIIKLHVIPESRRNNIEIWNGFELIK